VKVPAREISAFIIYCSATNELFHRGLFTRRIFVIAQGWEPAWANYVEGLPRKAPATAPSDIKRVERVLNDHGEAFFAGTSEPRLMSKRAVRDKINFTFRRETGLAGQNSIPTLDTGHLQGDIF